MHKLLERQLKKALRSSADNKVDYDILLEMVNATYEKFDRERRLTDRSMELVSKELLKLNRKIREQSEARVQAIMDNVIDGIVTVNENSIIESFNPSAERIFGYSATDVIGKSIDKLIPELGKHIRNVLIPELGEDVSKYLDNGQDVGHETVGQRKGGLIFPMDLAISEMRLDEKRIFIGVVRDITERKRAKEMLRENLAQLSKKNRYETIISTVTRSVHRSINLQEVLENAVEAMSKNIDKVDYVAIYLVEGEEAVLKAHKGFTAQYIERAGRIPYPKGFTWKAIMEEKSRYVADVDRDTAIGPAGRELGIKAIYPCPFTSKARRWDA